MALPSVAGSMIVGIGIENDAFGSKTMVARCECVEEKEKEKKRGEIR